MELMIDIETLATNEGAAIVQIGAAYFDRTTWVPQATFSQYIKPHPSATIDVDTVIWWLGGEAGMRKNLVDGMKTAHDEGVVLWDFKEWIAANGKPTKVWCQGLSFDPPHLKSAYARHGDVLPWAFWTECDTRTIFNELGYNYKTGTEEYLTVRPDLNHHEALTDCFAQIYCLQQALRILE